VNEWKPSFLRGVRLNAPSVISNIGKNYLFINKNLRWHGKDACGKQKSPVGHTASQ
jgi:hypothetical protein